MDKKTFKLYDQMVTISLLIKEAMASPNTSENPALDVRNLMEAQKLLLESMLISNHMAQKECKCEEK